MFAIPLSSRVLPKAFPLVMFISSTERKKNPVHVHNCIPFFHPRYRHALRDLKYVEQVGNVGCLRAAEQQIARGERNISIQYFHLI
jgi:hypothetical protein